MEEPEGALECHLRVCYELITREFYCPDGGAAAADFGVLR